ncbi:hypothetical protein ACW9HQ_48660 [Nocardia gipuzkoensis]
MDVYMTGPRTLAATILAVAVLVVGTALFLAYGPRKPFPPNQIRPVVATTTTPQPATPTATATAPGCWMFCHEPPMPAPDSHGCRLFCQLQQPTDEGSKP